MGDGVATGELSAAEGLEGTLGGPMLMWGELCEEKLGARGMALLVDSGTGEVRLGPAGVEPRGECKVELIDEEGDEEGTVGRGRALSLVSCPATHRGCGLFFSFRNSGQNRYWQHV